MLSREDNELMCRVGAGTAMGTALRRYWLPALQSSDLAEAVGAAKRHERLAQQFDTARIAPGVIAEDVAVSVSAGPIRDRTLEMLSTADVAVSMLHRVLLGSAKAAQRGEDPIGVGAGIDTSTIQGKTIYLKGSQQWQ